MTVENSSWSEPEDKSTNFAGNRSVDLYLSWAEGRENHQSVRYPGSARYVGRLKLGILLPSWSFSELDLSKGNPAVHALSSFPSTLSFLWRSTNGRKTLCQSVPEPFCSFHWSSSLIRFTFFFLRKSWLHFRTFDLLTRHLSANDQMTRLNTERECFIWSAKTTEKEVDHVQERSTLCSSSDLIFSFNRQATRIFHFLTRTRCQKFLKTLLLDWL